MAATLLLPGAARELSAAREAIPEALGELARFLHANRLEVVSTEQTFEDGGSLGAALTPLIDPLEIAALAGRCNRLRSDARFPAPHGQMPALPWPLF